MSFSKDVSVGYESLVYLVLQTHQNEQKTSWNSNPTPSVVSGRRPDLEQLLGISKWELDSALHCFADAVFEVVGDSVGKEKTTELVAMSFFGGAGVVFNDGFDFGKFGIFIAVYRYFDIIEKAWVLHLPQSAMLY